jgi:preprotein translocase subunit SecE
MGWWQRAAEFLTEVRNEMKRVTWPSQREVYATTLVVIIFSVLIGIYLFGVDLLIGRGVEWLLSRFGAAV